MIAPTVERRNRATSGILAVVAALSLTPAALAQESNSENNSPTSTSGSKIRLELNRLDPNGEACRTYLMVDNSKGEALRSLKVDLFAFDTDGVAQKRLAVELGPIGGKKTLVRLFDFSGIACPKIGRILLNDVLSCEGGEASREACLERIETASKTDAEFFR